MSSLLRALHSLNARITSDAAIAITGPQVRVSDESSAEMFSAGNGCAKW